jgi:hypothetical protein
MADGIRHYLGVKEQAASSQGKDDRRKNQDPSGFFSKVVLFDKADLC